MSSTDAQQLKSRVKALTLKAHDFNEFALDLVLISDQIKDIASSLGEDAPPVLSLIDLAADNLRTSNKQISQVAETLEDWAERL